jgi:hypothetical protein
VAVDKYTGQIITPAGAELIKERRADKAALLAEMRADRANAALDRHSHVGAEIGRSIAELEGMAIAYKALADLSNALIIRGHEHPAGTVASLARGVQRAALEYHGKEAAESLGDISQPAQTTYPSQSPPTSDELSLGNISQLEGEPMAQPELLQPSEGAAVMQEVMEKREPAITSMPKPEAMAPLTAADAMAPLATFEDDEPDLDLPGAAEEMVSPIIEESPRVMAARKRREAKRAAKVN